MSSPLVSVIVPAYNAARTIGPALASVRAQSLRDLEVIVVDDGSTDDTAARVAAVDDPRVRLVSYTNAGLAASRNRGVRVAAGAFVAFLDADDLWTADKLARQVAALERHPEAGVAYSWTAFVDEDGRLLHLQRPVFFAGDVQAAMLVGCFTINGSNVLVRRAVLDTVGEFDTALEAAEDWEFLTRVAARWPFVVVPEHQIFYRRSPQSISANIPAVARANHLVVERAFRAAPARLAHLKPRSLAHVNVYLARLHLAHGRGPARVLAAARHVARALRLEPRLGLAAGIWVLVVRCLAALVVPRSLADRALARLGRLWARRRGLRIPTLPAQSWS